jgi:endonuclease/exonuclease/phosphatase (EEP) superfamily protein YafD
MDFSILDWNIQGKKYYNIRTSFKKIQPVLEEINADIICLQEGESIIDKLDYYTKTKKYNCVFSHEDKDGVNVILSKFKIISHGEINCPSFIDKCLGEILWADIQLGVKILKLYNCHFEIDGIGPKERAEALEFVLLDSTKHSGPIIICGDFNTTVPAYGWGRKFISWFHEIPKGSLMLNSATYLEDERYSFIKIAEREKFDEATDISKTTWAIFSWRWEIFNLKLDWFFSRGLKASPAVLGKYISDHKSILVKCSIK